MNIEKKYFGTTGGKDVDIYTLTVDSGMSVSIITFGGAIRSFVCYGISIVGGFDTLESYLKDDSHQGALIGRIGNRICKGRFTLEGKDYSLFINNGPNHLHGGEYGFDKKIWDVISTTDSDEPALTLRYVSPDG